MTLHDCKTRQTSKSSCTKCTYFAGQSFRLGVMETGELVHKEAVDGTEERAKQNEQAPDVSKNAPDEQEQGRAREHDKQLASLADLNAGVEGITAHAESPRDREAAVEAGHISEESKHQIFLNELAESEQKMAAQLEAAEECHRQQAAEFTAEIERLKQHHMEELQNALDAASQAEQQMHTLKLKQDDEAVAESERKHNAEMQVLRAQLEELQSETGDFTKEEESSGKWKSLLPQYGSQLSPEVKKELRLQRERLQRQHKCELKALEQRLYTEHTLERDTLRAKLEEEYTAKLAKVLTASALKNATQVEHISQQLRLEKQQAVSQLENERETRREQELARLAQERREAVEACSAEFGAARVEYQSRITELEAALARERERCALEQHQQNWAEQEERLRGEMMTECRRRVDEVQAECDRDRESALTSLREALEQRLQTELTTAHQMHQQALLDNQAQLQALYEKKLSSVRETTQVLQSELQRDGQHEELEAIRAELARENMVKLQQMTEKLQAVHKAELVAMQREREAECSRRQEELEQAREEMETKLHQDLEQVSGC